MGQIGYDVEQQGSAYILHVRGEINARTLPQYRAIIDQLMAKLDVQHQDGLTFIMDYGGITDVDSAALANIIDRLKSDVRSDHRVVFVRVPEKFKSMVELNHLQDQIRIYATQKEALAALIDG